MTKDYQSLLRCPDVPIIMKEERVGGNSMETETRQLGLAGSEETEVDLEVIAEASEVTPGASEVMSEASEKAIEALEGKLGCLEGHCMEEEQEEEWMKKQDL